MDEQKERYNNVVRESLIEKGFTPMPGTIWTYYLRDLFKPTFGLTWFRGQWWCPDKKTYERIAALIADMDSLVAEHLSPGELAELEARLVKKSAWMKMKGD